MQVRAAKSGVGQYIYALLEQLLKIDNKNFYEIYCSAENLNNYIYSDTNSHSQAWGLNNVPKSFRLLYENLVFPSIISSQKLDVFWGPSNFLPAFKKCKYVATIHDLSYYVHPERCPALRRKYWYYMTEKTVKVADRIITISENSKADIIKFFPSTEGKIEVIHNATHHRFRPLLISRENSLLKSHESKLNGKPYLLYIGTLEPGKNVGRLISAFEKIADGFPDHQLVLGGDKGWLYSDVMLQIQNSPFNNRIHYLGHVTDEEVVHLYNFCEAFCFPSLYEGFGLPPLEAMSCGAPVLTSNNSSIPEVVGDAALQVNPLSVDEIAEGINLLLSDTELRTEFKNRGLERAKKFSWDKAAKQTLNVFESV